MFGKCLGNCSDNVGPPPDLILSMPPPPLPSFLIPKSLVATFKVSNDSHPCFAPFMCDSNPHPRDTNGMEFIELVGSNETSFDNTWLLVLIASCIAVLMLGGVLAFVLIKCKNAVLGTCTLSYHDTNIKQNTLTTLGEGNKGGSPFMTGGILYPCSTAAGREPMPSGHLTTDSRLLWATLTPHGTRHFIAENPNQDGHYEVVDYRSKPMPSTSAKEMPVRSFDNNGFIDYDYEDPTPLMESYHDDMDSGYQEPQEVFATINRSLPRQNISPTRMEHSNMSPLNFYLTHRTIQSNCNNSNAPSQYSTAARKASLNRRISDTSSFK